MRWNAAVNTEPGSILVFGSCVASVEVVALVAGAANLGSGRGGMHIWAKPGATEFVWVHENGGRAWRKRWTTAPANAGPRGHRDCPPFPTSSSRALYAEIIYDWGGRSRGCWHHVHPGARIVGPAVWSPSSWLLGIDAAAPRALYWSEINDFHIQAKTWADWEADKR